MEKLFNLLERFVVAVEKIAEKESTPSSTSTKTETVEASFEAETAGTPLEDQSHAALKTLCEEKGWEVPARTKKTTLLKWLKEGGPEKKKESEDFEDSEVKNENPFDDLDDDFEDPLAEDEEEEELTREDVLSALQKVITKFGKPEVSKILRKYDAQKLSDLAEDHFSNVVKDAKAMLGE